ASQCAGTAGDVDAPAAGLHFQCTLTIRDANAAARSPPIERTAQTRELQSATARVRFRLSGEVAHADAAAGCFELGVELRRHRDRVFALRTLPAVPGPAHFAFRPRADGHGVALLREVHRPLAQKFFFARLVSAADFSVHVHDDFAGRVGADVDGPKIHVHDDFAARLDGEALVDLFLGLRADCETTGEHEHGDQFHSDG